MAPRRSTGRLHLRVRQTEDTYTPFVICMSAAIEAARRDGRMSGMHEIGFDQARAIAERKGLRPTRVRGTSALRFSKEDHEGLELITWDEFERVASWKRLAVYESGGWMKLMRRP